MANVSLEGIRYCSGVQVVTMMRACAGNTVLPDTNRLDDSFFQCLNQQPDGLRQST